MVSPFKNHVLLKLLSFQFIPRTFGKTSSSKVKRHKIFAAKGVAGVEHFNSSIHNYLLLICDLKFHTAFTSAGSMDQTLRSPWLNLSDLRAHYLCRKGHERVNSNMMKIFVLRNVMR